LEILILVTLVSVWALLMLRSVMAEYAYYQSVKTREPQIWQQLGAPRFLKVPMVFVSSKGTQLLQQVTDAIVRENALKHHRAGKQFLFYIVAVLVLGIVYLKLA